MHARLADACERASVDVVVARTQAAVRHLTAGWYTHNYDDFWAGADQQYASWLVVAPAAEADPIYLCSGLELAEARLAGHPVAGYAREGAGFTRLGDPETLAAAVRELGGERARVGLELPFISAPAHDALRAALPAAELVDAHGLLLYVRAVKTDRELELIANATKLLEGAIADVFAAAGEGVSDHDLDLAALEAVAARGGTPQQRFIVPGLGPGRSRFGAGNPVGYRLESGDVLLVDLGAKLHGMHGDLVQVGSVGEPHFPVADALALGVEVNREVAELLRPGMTQADARAEAQRLADARAADVAPWGVPTALHHGLGWALYEPPFDISGGPPLEGPLDPYAVLEEGMTMSLETAVFSPDGSELYANVEDPWVLRADGCRRLNSVPHELRACGAVA